MQTLFREYVHTQTHTQTHTHTHTRERAPVVKEGLEATAVDHLARLPHRVRMVHLPHALQRQCPVSNNIEENVSIIQKVSNKARYRYCAKMALCRFMTLFRFAP